MGAAAAICSTAASAHPHVFITARAEVIFDEDGLIQSVRHVWKFDSAWSAYAVQGLDADGSGGLSQAELQPLAELNVNAVASYSFFTTLTIGEFRAAFVPPTESSVEIHGTQLQLSMTLPLDIPHAPDGVVRLDVYDPQYYVAFDFEPVQPVRLVNAPSGCTAGFEAASEPDDDTAALLAMIPAGQRDIPADLMTITRNLSNTIRVACP